MTLSRQPCMVPELSLGARVPVGAVTFIPLLGRDAGVALVPLSRAVASGAVSLRELSPPRVPVLECLNRGTRDVIAFEGQLLDGGWQDRVVAETTVIPARRRVELGVRCVERGRWSSAGRGFTVSQTAPVAVRAALSADGGAQGRVWESVTACLNERAVRAPTETLVACFGPVAADPAAVLSALPPAARGFACYSGEQLLGLELFDSAATLTTLWDGLARGYLLSAGRNAGEPGLDEAAGILRELEGVAWRTGRVELSLGGRAAVAFVHAEALCHLAVLGAA